MKLSIFTPTYNRAALLRRVYESLKNQTKDFEWIIVDDGSCDNTEEVIKEITDDADFSIKYIKKENGGKHTAHNRAIAIAEGDFFLCLDSDDKLADGFVEKFIQFKPENYSNVAGFIAYKMTDNGKYLSEMINTDGCHSIYDFSNIYSAIGEFCFIFRTEILKNYPYPEIDGERFSTEGVVYDRLDLNGYLFKAMPLCAQVCEYQEGGLTSNIKKSLVSSPTGYMIYHMQRINLVNNTKDRIRHIIRYHSFRRMTKHKEIKYVGKHKILVGLLSFSGILGRAYYKKYEK